MANGDLTRRQALGALGAGASLALGARAAFPARTSDPRPNIVMILADDLGYGDLGCYGQRDIATPHLDALAAAGTRFTEAYAGSTVCAPSRCCLMTGRHTGHAHIRGNARVPLRPTDTTVATCLRQAGYRTALFGKWGLGEAGSTGVPTRQGFDEFFGYLNQVHAHNYWPTHLWENEERFPLANIVPDENDQGGGVATVRRQYSHDLFTERALDYVWRQRAEPFFLYLAYTLPHANNEAKARGMEIPSQGRYRGRRWPEAQRNHAAMISRLDADVGRLVRRLEEARILDRTLLIFTSDNGPHAEGGARPDFFRSSGPLRGIKRALYEGGIRVPAIACWPGHVPAGAVNRTPWAQWDFLPTACELAGVTPPPGLDGVSIVPALLGREQPPHPPLYWEFHERGFHQAVRWGTWKAVRRDGRRQPVELYDLATDLGEERDLAAAQPAITRSMARLMDELRTESPEFPARDR